MTGTPDAVLLALTLAIITLIIGLCMVMAMSAGHDHH
jgi:hypothetical protein